MSTVRIVKFDPKSYWPTRPDTTARVAWHSQGFVWAPPPPDAVNGDTWERQEKGRPLTTEEEIMRLEAELKIGL